MYISNHQSNRARLPIMPTMPTSPFLQSAASSQETVVHSTEPTQIEQREIETFDVERKMLQQLNMHTLRALLSKTGKPVSGNKDQLIDRLLNNTTPQSFTQNKNSQ